MQDNEIGFPEYLRDTIKQIRKDYSELVEPKIKAKIADMIMSRNSPSYFGKGRNEGYKK